ncbi:MAG: 3-oxoadipate enol-lactonase [Deltaproteobacteria bacterium]|nr:3-oxoadipate enol-lactonase [Deltaproteobacteria bacterium]MBW2137828.1 3-oxoadipate enol-lactonase [Deltaproteobacteria bacterium]
MRIKVGEIQLNYEVSGNKDGDILVMSHSLGCNLSMWEPQLGALESRFRVLRYDTRGHGKSDVPKGPYTLDQLVRDAADLMDALGIEQAHWVGLSMGGMIGQGLALDYPGRLKSLVLCDTASVMPDEAQPIWDERIGQVRRGGMKARIPETLRDWFTPEFVEKNPPVLEKVRQQLLSTPVEGYVGCIEAFRKLDYIGRLHQIKIPTLIMVGEKDPGTPVEASRAMHERIRGSKLVILPSAAHLSNAEQPEAFTKALMDFFSKM